MEPALIKGDGFLEVTSIMLLFSKHPIEVMDSGDVTVLCDWFLHSRCLMVRCAASPRWLTDLLAVV